MTTNAKTAFGIMTPGPSLKDDPIPIGIFTLVLGSPEIPFVQKVGPDGKVTGFISIPAMNAKEFVAIKNKVEARVGSDHLLAWVRNAATPEEAEVLPWTEMVGKVLTDYPAMRTTFLKFPLAGFRVANFVLGLAPECASAAKPATTVDFGPFGPEIDRIAADDANTFRRSPEVRWLANELAIDMKPQRVTELLP